MGSNTKSFSEPVSISFFNLEVPTTLPKIDIRVHNKRRKQLAQILHCFLLNCFIHVSIVEGLNFMPEGIDIANVLSF